MRAQAPVEIRSEKAAERPFAEFVQLRNVAAGRDVLDRVDRHIMNQFPALLDRPANLFNRLGAGDTSKQLQERLEIEPRHDRGIGIFLAKGFESLLVSDLRERL